VAVSQLYVFRWRWIEISHGWSLKCANLADDTRRFLRFLEEDPAILRYQAREPEEWQRIKARLYRMAWYTYYERWAGLYRQRLPLLAWVKAGFALPYIAEYYQIMKETLWYAVRAKCIMSIKRLTSGSHKTDGSAQ
jgi:hypothetical protein